MSREEWKSIHRWLDTASLRELDERAQQLRQLLKVLRDPDVRRDARHILSDIEQEKFVRTVLKPPVNRDGYERPDV